MTAEKYHDTLTLFMKCDLVCIIIASSYIQQRDTSRIKLPVAVQLLVNKMPNKSGSFTLLWDIPSTHAQWIISSLSCTPKKAAKIPKIVYLYYPICHWALKISLLVLLMVHPREASMS